jgi:AcrR family transcriptional regulator
MEVLMAKDTKERILAAALEQFSQNGYAGTNIRELTASLGLVKSAMYKHFESKEDIWNTLLDEMIVYYDEHFGSSDHLPPVPDTLEGLAEMTRQMVDFTVHDEKVVKTRKLLTIEQFRDERVRSLATKHFLTGLKEMFTPIFKGMMDKGLIRRDDPAMVAFAYTAPISTLIHLCDREPEKTEEAMAQVEAFIQHFFSTYGVMENEQKSTCGNRYSE